MTTLVILTFTDGETLLVELTYTAFNELWLSGTYEGRVVTHARPEKGPAIPFEVPDAPSSRP